MNIQFAIGIAAAAISVIGGISAFLYRKRVDDVTRKRLMCAEALTALLEWLEMPYRIRRRPAGDVGVRLELTNKMHDLQTKIDFHLAWLEVESPRVAAKYESLNRAVKALAGPAIQQAWAHSGISSDVEMNIGPLGKFDIEKPQSEFIKAVRNEIRVWRIGWQR